ncbi:MAG: hypothetical protein ACLPQS_14375 [Acidimicrobiales bacterium]|jgi:hypothetical protein
MESAQLQQHMDNMFDQALVFHGFTEYMRDYELFVFCTADPRTGIEPEHVRFVFKLCVLAEVTSAVPESVWQRSLDDRLIDYETGKDLEGYVWGVKWQVLYPGGRIVADSALADRWSRALGVDFHEVEIGTNGHNLRLVFSDLSANVVEPGYAPFTVPPNGPHFKIPLG